MASSMLPGEVGLPLPHGGMEVPASSLWLPLSGGVSLLGPASPPYIAGDVNENFPSNFALLFFPVLARNPRMQGMATATKSPPF